MCSTDKVDKLKNVCYNQEGRWEEMFAYMDCNCNQIILRIQDDEMLDLLKNLNKSTIKSTLLMNLSQGSRKNKKFHEKVLDMISKSWYNYQKRRKTPSFSYGDIRRVLRSPRRAEGGQYFYYTHIPLDERKFTLVEIV